MKIVVLDGYTENPGDLSWGELETYGELTVYDRTPLEDEPEIIRRIGDAEIVFTNKTPVSRGVIDHCPHIRFIGLLATGYNVVDHVYARKRGIPVTNVPSYGVASVSQFAIALLLEVCHHIGHHDQAAVSYTHLDVYKRQDQTSSDQNHNSSLPKWERSGNSKATTMEITRQTDKPLSLIHI